MYDIEIDYTTGNSYSRNRRIEILCNPVSGLDNAKENLRRIREHYISVLDDQDFEERHSLDLLTDCGVRAISPFWIGCHETLHGARICSEDSSLNFEI